MLQEVLLNAHKHGDEQSLPTVSLAKLPGDGDDLHLVIVNRLKPDANPDQPPRVVTGLATLHKAAQLYRLGAPHCQSDRATWSFVAQLVAAKFISNGNRD